MDNLLKTCFVFTWTFILFILLRLSFEYSTPDFCYLPQVVATKKKRKFIHRFNDFEHTDNISLIIFVVFFMHIIRYLAPMIRKIGHQIPEFGCCCPPQSFCYLKRFVPANLLSNSRKAFEFQWTQRSFFSQKILFKKK